MEYTPEEIAEWRDKFGTDEEIAQKKAIIAREGLTARVHLDLGPWYNGRRLWMLILEPVEGRWTHMRRTPEKVAELLNEGPYHISILFQHDITTVWQQRLLNTMWNEYREPFEYTFYVQSWGGGMTANIRHDRLWADVFDLHKGGSYKTGQIHISM